MKERTLKTGNKIKVAIDPESHPESQEVMVDFDIGAKYEGIRKDKV